MEMWHFHLGALKRSLCNSSTLKTTQRLLSGLRDGLLAKAFDNTVLICHKCLSSYFQVWKTNNDGLKSQVQWSETMVCFATTWQPERMLYDSHPLSLHLHVCLLFNNLWCRGTSNVTIKVRLKETTVDPCFTVLPYWGILLYGILAGSWFLCFSSCWPLFHTHLE